MIYSRNAVPDAVGESKQQELKHTHTKRKEQHNKRKHTNRQRRREATGKWLLSWHHPLGHFGIRLYRRLVSISAAMVRKGQGDGRKNGWLEKNEGKTISESDCM